MAPNSFLNRLLAPCVFFEVGSFMASKASFKHPIPSWSRSLSRSSSSIFPRHYLTVRSDSFCPDTVGACASLVSGFGVPLAHPTISGSPMALTLPYGLPYVDGAAASARTHSPTSTSSNFVTSSEKGTSQAEDVLLILLHAGLFFLYSF